MKKKIKVRIPRPKLKFYKECDLDDETWDCLRYYHKHKRDLERLERGH
jgi:hypothetical protein